MASVYMAMLGLMVLSMLPSVPDETASLALFLIVLAMLFTGTLV